ncbi:MAG: NAD(P)H-binding protein [Rhodospirillaceae bacterium]|nr:NAD(P)H-binding protein [Rhodospirillaceae bacterium]
MRILIFGATGLVGRDVLKLALADARVTAVIAPTRRGLSQQPKLQAPVVNFDKLPEDVPWWQADALICALGTTMRVAGSKQAFRRVDYEYPLAVARCAKKHGVRTYVLNSSLGANPAARSFYLQVKGETERDLASLDFASLTYVRPGLIGGERDEFRPAEQIMMPVLTLLGPLLPKSWRINPAPTIARALLEAAIAAEPGKHIITSDRLTGLP